LKLKRGEDKIINYLREKKINADRQWDTVFSKCLTKEVDQIDICAAITRCNEADKNLMDHEYDQSRKPDKPIQRGSGMSDEEFERRFITPYATI
jgi:hypothetical protein